MSYSLLCMLKVQTSQTFGGGTSSKILQQYNSIIVYWWVSFLRTGSTDECNAIQAMTTYFSTALLYTQTFRPAVRAALPPLARVATTAAFAMVNVQVLLGISTLLYLVPIPLAAAHQAGSVALLSAMIHLLITLRRPGLAARLMRIKPSVKRGSPGPATTHK